MGQTQEESAKPEWTSILDSGVPRLFSKGKGK